MIPPQLHISLELLSSAGMLAMSTVGAPGAQGAAVTGRQGIGVRTPSAAAVAAATIGFAGEEQTPKGGMLTIGLLSSMLAAGVPVRVLFVGSTTRVEGAAPKLHIIAAPMQTCIAMSSLPVVSFVP